MSEPLSIRVRHGRLNASWIRHYAHDAVPHSVLPLAARTSPLRYCAADPRRHRLVAARDDVSASWQSLLAACGQILVAANMDEVSAGRTPSGSATDPIAVGDRG